MEYREYSAKFRNPSLRKRLGLLGEAHDCTYVECEFADMLHMSYKNIAVEGRFGEMPPVIGKLIGISLLPRDLTYKIATNRTYKGTIYRLLRSASRNLIFLEADDKNDFRQFAAFGLYGLVTTFLSPILYGYYNSVSEEKEKSNFLLKYLINIEKRDKKMALKIADILKSKTDLLVICGKFHLDGLEKNLSKKLKMKKRIHEFLI